ncbi:LysR family transcriptional regulator [Shewanella sp. NIFS-20-20]|uniref:LysR family transcriptional regulator n=1 Tax=Shewanella sp. NIFS-20-20 TaxID=2853806 RepID=UPI001C464863|nr:LysR family transcriptional regulator [Shewanella sp. NIFS-20-20]MBV7316528.1 LysR family transcriptional regulator [Shewanella sp. NIFS-20-20]
MNTLQLSRINLKHLTVLQVLLQTSSVTSTAQQLCLSPSTVSKTLAQLRLLLGDELFYREGNQLSATPIAHSLAPALHAVLSSMQGLLQPQQFIPEQFQGKFRLAMRDSCVELFADVLSKHLIGACPQAQVTLYAKEHYGMDALLKGLVDVVILPHDISQPPTQHQDLLWQALLTDEMVCLMAADHPLAHQANLSIEDYLRYRHIGITDSELNQPYFELLLAQQYHARSIALTVADFGSAAAMCQRSQLLFTCSQLWSNRALQAQHLIQKSLPFDYGNVGYSLVWHPQSLNNPAIKWLQQQLVSTLGQMG